MITTEEIAQVAYRMLTAAKAEGILDITGQVAYERTDYTNEDVIVIPHTIDGEASLRFGQINVNIHVPDLVMEDGGKTVTLTDMKRLTELRARVIDILKNHVEKGAGWNWYIGRLNPPIPEPGHTEHFVSLALELTVREK